MYIRNTNDNVIKLFSYIEKLSDESKLKILIYIFNLINNNQINDRNEVNPDLLLNDDLKILKFSYIGLNDNYCEIIMQYLISVYNLMNKNNKVMYIESNVIGLVYTEEEKIIIYKFENLSFNDKLDIIRELFIRYDNETYFNKKITMVSFDSKLNGFDIANNILKFKESNYY